MGSIHRYELIKEGEEVKDEPQQQSTTAVTSWWKFLLCNILAASASAGATFLIAHRTSTSGSGSAVATTSTSTTPLPEVALPTPSLEPLDDEVNSPNMLVGTILDCGGNPSDARAKGCVYDVMMQDWVPEPCYDGALTERYLADGNWTWYADGAGVTTISDEDMRKGEHGTAWMSSSYHKAHCVFSWNKIIRALRNNRGISQELISYDHVLHCSHGALKERGDEEGVGVGAPTNYAKCALYDTWKQNFIPDKHNATQR